MGHELVNKLGAAGCTVWPTAPYAPWQKGKVERRIRTLKETMGSMVLHSDLHTEADMGKLAYEVAQAYNHRVGPSGFSQSQRLFGGRARLYGELYDSGESVGWHPEVLQAGGDMSRRMELRRLAQELVLKAEHKELILSLIHI